MAQHIMQKKELLEFLNKAENKDVSCMVYRETVFEIISYGKSNKIHIATTASTERIKKVFADLNPADSTKEKNTIEINLSDNTVVFIHSLFSISYDDFVNNMVPTNLTFNSLLMKANGQLFDFYNGLNDLKNKKMDFVKNFDTNTTDSSLLLNCIRYMFKYNFSYTDTVKDYIIHKIGILTKNEKANALFYLFTDTSEKALKSDNASIILSSNEFFSTKEIPVSGMENYKNIITDVGATGFIYLCLFFLHTNILKTRIADLIDKNEYKLYESNIESDLNDEDTYYTIKGQYGFEFLSKLIDLQAKYNLLIGKKYDIPVFHKKNIFDKIEQTTEAVDFNFSELKENQISPIVSKATENVFDKIENSTKSQNIDNTDFSSIFDVSDNEKIDANISDEKNDFFDKSNQKLSDDGVISDEVGVADEPAEEKVISVTQETECKQDSHILQSDDSKDFNIDDAINEVSNFGMSKENEKQNQIVCDKVETESVVNFDTIVDASNNTMENTVQTSDSEDNVSIQEENCVDSNVSNKSDDDDDDFSFDDYFSVDLSKPVTKQKTMQNKTVISPENDIALNTTENNCDKNEQSRPITEVQDAEPKIQSRDDIIDDIFDEPEKLREINFNDENGELVNIISAVNQSTNTSENDNVASTNNILNNTSQKVSEQIDDKPRILSAEKIINDATVDDSDIAAVLKELNDNSKSSFLDDESDEEYSHLSGDTATGDFFENLSKDFNNIVIEGGK